MNLDDESSGLESEFNPVGNDYTADLGYGNYDGDGDGNGEEGSASGEYDYGNDYDTQFDDSKMFRSARTGNTLPGDFTKDNIIIIIHYIIIRLLSA